MSRPTTSIRVFLLAFVAALSSSIVAAADGALRYRLTYPGSTSERVAVAIELPGGTSPRALVVPRAIPMGYAEQPYARFVSRVRAFATDGEPLGASRIDGPRWSIGARDQERLLGSVTYEVDLDAMEHEILDASAASKVRSDYVGILGYSTFGYLEGLEDSPIRLELAGPADWPLFTTLHPEAQPATGRLETTAADFYALADSQIMMGPALRVRREGGRPLLFVAGYAEAPWDIELTGRLGREALDALVDYFGEAPFPHFSMVVEVLDPLTPEHEYGFSMEHLSSATFFLGPQGALTESSSPSQRRRVLYNYAHHIAHAWIPKRCAGPGYFPFEWEFAPVIDTIWFSEGFGQYAAAVALSQYLEGGSEWLERLIEQRFRKPLAEAPRSIRRMTTTELSRVASTRYGSDFRLGRNVFSRGALMAAEMDAQIRAETNGAKSLRDALRYLIASTREHGGTFRIEDLPRLLGESTGVDVSAIYSRWLAPHD